MSIQEFKCPSCGGAVQFDSASQKLKCPFCDTEFDTDAMLSHEEEVASQAEDTVNLDSSETGAWSEADGMHVYVCKSCAGEIVAEATTSAMSCPYCGNPVVMKEMLSGDLKPDLIIPFKIDKNAAKEALKKHMSGKKLLPRTFKSESHLDEIKGVYVPYWLFDAQAHANMCYDGTRVRTWTDARNIYTETSHFSIVRDGTLQFEAVPVDGSSKIQDELMESIEPFDVSQAEPFKSAFLAGYVADRYDVTEEQSKERANARIKASTSSAFANTVQGYNSVTPQASTIHVDGVAKYGLFPVWLLTTGYRGEHYLFAVNGQTGAIAGNMPVDKGIYRKMLLSYGFGTGAVLYILSLVLRFIGII